MKLVSALAMSVIALSLSSVSFADDATTTETPAAAPAAEAPSTPTEGAVAPSQGTKVAMEEGHKAAEAPKCAEAKTEEACTADSFKEHCHWKKTAGGMCVKKKTHHAAKHKAKAEHADGAEHKAKAGHAEGAADAAPAEGEHAAKTEHKAD